MAKQLCWPLQPSILFPLHALHVHRLPISDGIWCRDSLWWADLEGEDWRWSRILRSLQHQSANDDSLRGIFCNQLLPLLRLLNYLACQTYPSRTNIHRGSYQQIWKKTSGRARQGFCQSIWFRSLAQLEPFLRTGGWKRLVGSTSSILPHTSQRWPQLGHCLRLRYFLDLRKMEEDVELTVSFVLLAKNRFIQILFLFSFSHVIIVINHDFKHTIYSLHF